MPMSGKKRAFLGQYRHSVDEKGRVSIPADFRPLLLGERGSFFVNWGVERCVMAYPEDKWEQIVEMVNAVAIEDENTRWYKRAFFSGAREVSCDQQGRILIPQPLMEYARITKEVVIVGVSNRVEIWDAETWDASLPQALNEYGKRTERMTHSSPPTKSRPDETTGDVGG